jgi:hypothetical protein
MAPKTILLTRHAEKPTDPMDPDLSYARFAREPDRRVAASAARKARRCVFTGRSHAARGSQQTLDRPACVRDECQANL